MKNSPILTEKNFQHFLGTSDRNIFFLIFGISILDTTKLTINE